MIVVIDLLDDGEIVLKPRDSLAIRLPSLLHQNILGKCQNQKRGFQIFALLEVPKNKQACACIYIFRRKIYYYAHVLKN